MWIVLRFLTVIVVYIWKFLWRQQGVDESEPHHGAISVRKTVTGKKGRFIKAFLGLDYAGPLRFQLTRERFWDSFFKGLGLAVEQETGDPEFDRQIYITCDQPALGHLLRESEHVRRSVLALFSAGADRIFSDGANVWMETTNQFHDRDAILKELQVLRAGLRTIDNSEYRSRLDAFFWKAVAVESLIWSVAAYGIPGFIELAWHRNTLYVAPGNVFGYGLVCSLGVFAVLFGLVILLLFRSSRGHRLMLESFFVLLVGVPLSTVQAVSDININLDRTPATITGYQVTGKYIRTVRRRKGGTSYYYHLRIRPEKTDALAGKTDIETEPSIYQSIPESGGRIEVRSHPGRLGFSWIEEIRPK